MAIRLSVSAVLNCKEMYFAINNSPALKLLALGFAGLVLLLIHSMDLNYTSLQLHNLNRLPRLESSTFDLCTTLGIARRTRYIHRSAKRRWL